VVSFRDFPEAHTEGDDKAEALAQAADCVEEVLALYIINRRPIPEPSIATEGEHVIAPGSLIAAKAACCIALRRSGIGQRELARRMKVPVAQVTRLLNPRHHSRADQIDLALKAVGMRLILSLDSAT
jgi:antitoxin HicB